MQTRGSSQVQCTVTPETWWGRCSDVIIRSYLNPPAIKLYHASSTMSHLECALWPKSSHQKPKGRIVLSGKTCASLYDCAALQLHHFGMELLARGASANPCDNRVRPLVLNEVVVKIPVLPCTMVSTRIISFHRLLSVTMVFGL